MLYERHASGLLLPARPPEKPPEPEFPPKLARCPECGSVDIEYCEKTSTYKVHCNACKKPVTPWLYSGRGGGIVLPEWVNTPLKNQDVGEPELT